MQGMVAGVLDGVSPEPLLIQTRSLMMAAGRGCLFKARELAKGDYILILFGQTLNGRSEEIYRYSFRVS
jgi:hypothetical protein